MDSLLKIDKTMNKCFQSVNESDSNMEPANLVDGMFAIARALNGVADSILKLGNNDAGTRMGAIEALGLVVDGGLKSLSESTACIATALENIEGRLR